MSKYEHTATAEFTESHLATFTCEVTSRSLLATSQPRLRRAWTKPTKSTVFVSFRWPKGGPGAGAEIDIKSMKIEADMFGSTVDLTDKVCEREPELFDAILTACETTLQSLDKDCTCHSPYADGGCGACGPQDDDWLNAESCAGPPPAWNGR